MKYSHPTETDPRTVAFLQQSLGSTAFKRTDGADLQVGPLTVEVKSCREWNSTRYANGERRHGRFQINGTEDADYLLFVVVKEDGQYLTKLRKGSAFKQAQSINWTRIFRRHRNV